MPLMTTRKTTEPVAAKPPLLDPMQHPDYLALLERRGVLRARRREIAEGDTRTQARLAEADRQLNALETRKLLDGVEPAELPAFQEARARLEQERRDVLREAPQLEAALIEIDRRLADVAGRVAAEIRPAVLARHRALAEQLFAHLRAASTVNDELRELCAHAGGWLTLPLYSWGELGLVASTRGDDYLHRPEGQSKLSQWYREGRAAGYFTEAGRH
jgi:hypothetical protein